MRLSRRAALALPALAWAGTARATLPVTILTGAPPGSGPDLWVRGFAPFLERHWPGTSVTVVNRHGEAGLVAARAVAAAAPDGYLLGAIATPSLLARAVERNQLPLLDRLRMVAAVAEEPLLLVTSPNGPAQDLKGLRKHARDGRIGTPPPGSAGHLAATILAETMPLLPLAFANAAAARQAVIAGHVACAMLSAPEAITAIREARLVAIGVAQAERSSLLPEVATLAEQGLSLPMVAQRGFAVPAGTDNVTLLPLRVALRAAIADPEFAAQAEAGGYVPRYLRGSEWEAAQRLLLGTLQDRWAQAPWRQAAQ